MMPTLAVQATLALKILRYNGDEYQNDGGFVMAEADRGKADTNLFGLLLKIGPTSAKVKAANVEQAGVFTNVEGDDVKKVNRVCVCVVAATPRWDAAVQSRPAPGLSPPTTHPSHCRSYSR